MENKTVKKNVDSQVKQYETIDLLELSIYLLKRWIWLLLALVIGCVGALILYYYTVNPLYKASAEIYITNSGTVINVQDVQLSAELTVDYEEILLSRKVLKKVIADQNLDIDYRTLKEMLSVTNPTDSHCIVISTTADSADEAIDITNSLVKYGIDQIYRTVGKDEPSVIDSAEADAVDEVQTSWKKYAAIGGLLGLGLICMVFTVLFLLDTTLKTDEDVEKYLHFNVLAVVPEAVSDKKIKRGQE